MFAFIGRKTTSYARSHIQTLGYLYKISISRAMARLKSDNNLSSRSTFTLFSKAYCLATRFQANHI
jgi:hypothetical protein